MQSTIHLLNVRLEVWQVISNSRERLHCVSGRGTLFMNRDIMFPDSWWLTHSPFASTGLDHMFDALILYDGNNEQEVGQPRGRRWE